jgi:tRNA (cmo5U34)-methyltransferase
MNEFDAKAAEWDLNPMHFDRSEAIAKEIIRLIPLRNNMTALEYGAGTGICSFLLRDHLKEIILMDNSSEMVKMINQKIENTKVKNLKASNFNLEDQEYRDGKFDLIFTQMVMHHVNDVDKMIGIFNRLLNDGGFLVIADLYEEDGSFHGEGFTGHNGFNMEWLSGIAKKKGFKDVSHRTCFVINRQIPGTESKKYEVFLLTAKKA